MLDRIEHRSIRRQPLQTQASLLSPQEISNRLALVHGSAIPNDRDRPGGLGQQSVEEQGDGHVIEIVVDQGSIRQTNRLTFRREPERCGEGDFLTMATPLSLRGSFSARSPGSANQGSHQQAAFVDENKVGTVLTDFF